jgi:hypothetical protein
VCQNLSKTWMPSIHRMFTFSVEVCQNLHILCRSVSKPLRGAAGCWGEAEKSVSGPDFNGIERGLVVYRRPLGLAASEALATQHYRRRFESCHRTLVDSHRPSVSELEPACALPRCHGAFFRNGRADECCGLLIFWPEHEMHLHASLLIGTPEKNEVFCTTQKTLAIDTLQQASCSLWVGCRRRKRVLCSISRPIARTVALHSGAGLNACGRGCLRLRSVFLPTLVCGHRDLKCGPSRISIFHRRVLCSISRKIADTDSFYSGAGLIAPGRGSLRLRWVFQRRVLCSISPAPRPHIMRLHEVGLC